MQRTAVRDRHHLHASAHPEHRHAKLTGAAIQGELRCITRLAWLVGRGVRLLVVQACIHVSATHQHKSVETLDGLCIHRRWKHHDSGSRILKEIDVPVRQKGSGQIPRSPLGRLEVGRQSDDGAAHPRSLTWAPSAA